MFGINVFSPFIGRLENLELRDVCFLKVAEMFLKSYGIDYNQKTTHKKILLNIIVISVYYQSFIRTACVVVHLYSKNEINT